MTKSALPETTELEEIYLLGLSLKHKTSNANGQSAIDCGNLWQQFEKEDIAARLPNKLNDEILAVYHDYDGDHNQPYAYFIGCKADKGEAIPEGFDSLTIPKATYQKMNLQGKMPDCVVAAWQEIWNSDHPRAYRADFEVYDGGIKDWSKVEVELYLSVKAD